MLGISVDNTLENVNASLSMTVEGSRPGASLVVGTSVQLHTTVTVRPSS